MNDMAELFCTEFGYFCWYYTKQSPILAAFLIWTTILIYLAMKEMKEGF